MARATKKLTDTWLRKAKVGNGVYADGESLYLRVQGENRSWLFIYRGADGRRREMGLGGYPSVGLGVARELATSAREWKAKGLDPIEVRRLEREAAAAAEKATKEVKVTTFRMVAEDWIAVKTKGLTVATRDRYQGYLRNWCAPIADLPVGDVGTPEVVSVLTPIWDTPTGPYVRSFIERVLTRAMKLDHRPEVANPARFKDHIEELLHERDHQTINHAAMPWAEVPALMKRLAAVEGVGSACFRFAILCGLRQSEARQLRWRQVHDDRIVFAASEYKTRREHVVPLSPQGVMILEEQARGSNPDPDDLVFKGRLESRPLSHHTFEYLLTDLEVACKPHGFRTSLVGWVKQNGFEGSSCSAVSVTCRELLSSAPMIAKITSIRSAPHSMPGACSSRLPMLHDAGLSSGAGI